ncbi:MAG TPA: TonB-dependent receptor [Bryobacteraceae bacterium]|nr:TonB-dependent receptor [Bryobacteraceae bacterium]
MKLNRRRHRMIQAAIGLIATIGLTGSAAAQSLGNAGTIEGTVVDQTGASVPKARIHLSNAITGYSQNATTAQDGSFRLVNIPPNPYHLDVTASGFGVFAQDVSVRNAIPIQVNAILAVAGEKTTITVEATGGTVETDPSAHVDVDRSLILKLPSSDPGAGLSQAIVYSTGGVAADANGFFHPLGDHAQVSFVIDGQPISDQQSKLYSTQLPTSAIQSMEATTGTPSAEFGDKSSLVAQITTRSGLGAGKIFGNVDATYGSFGTTGGSVGLGFGNTKFGNFLAVDGLRTGRFLDAPEFTAFHDRGNNQTIFDRLDYQPTGKDILHLNLFTARSWFQIPNDYDQLGQDQHERVLTWNVAPGYQHTFSAHTLLTINPYIRKDQVNYFASRDPFADTPATQSQTRHLLNWGVKADISTTQGHNNIKYGIDLKQTRLLENFGFGITDAGFNSPCIDKTGSAIPDSSLTDPGQCAAAGFEPNTADNPDVVGRPFSPALLRFDLTRSGRLFAFHGSQNINQYAFYGQDEITWNNFQFNIGIRLDRYDGIVSKTGPEPRAGIAYNIKKTGTVLRVAYARTFETPFNENLILSSATGAGGLAQNVFGSTSVPIEPGFRNQFNTGFQQAVGKFLLIDADYFWKYTHNAYDFGTLLNTTIAFPIAWHNSKLDGVTGRVSTTNIHGFQAYWTVGHTRARYFFPEVGGLILQGTPLNGSVFRIDHDQVLQSTLNLRYQRPKNAEWVSLIYRYDSGLVVSGVPDAGAALALTPNQQVSIGLACNGIFATVANPLSDCVLPGGQMGTVTSKLLALPQGGYGSFPSQQNADHNPDRVKPRNVFNLGVGTDNLLHSEGHVRYTASLEIANVTNVTALYNFLSTFSGTHFLQPRTMIARFGIAF